MRLNTLQAMSDYIQYKDTEARQLVDRKVAEIKRLAPIKPTPSFIQGSLESILEMIVQDCPQARSWLERSVTFSETLPTP